MPVTSIAMKPEDELVGVMRKILPTFDAAVERAILSTEVSDADLNKLAWQSCKVHQLLRNSSPESVPGTRQIKDVFTIMSNVMFDYLEEGSLKERQELACAGVDTYGLT